MDQKLLKREKGYVYFQEFIPNNTYDTRILVVGDRCFSSRRYVRKNDFRASGSGSGDHSPNFTSKESLKIAFDLADKLNIQSLSLDLIIDNNQFKITEMSYAFPIYAYDDSQGYWDRELNWHEGSYVPQYWMLENFLNEIAEIKK